MARTLIAAIAAPGCYGPGVTGIVLIETAADVANFQATTLTGREVLVAHNTDSGAQTVSVTSSNDPFGRVTDINGFSIPAGGIAIFGPFAQTGWLQADGKLYYKASSALVKFAVISVPSSL